MRWTPELPANIRSSESTKLEWLIRSFRSISIWSQYVQNEIAELSGIITYGAEITFNAGDGTPHGDLNATDFTGHPHAIGSALEIKSNAVVTFGHNEIAYLWTGPGGVTVGVGGTHNAVDTDLTPIGTANHNILTNRSLADQHPTSAITNLDSQQAAQDSAITTNANNLANHIATNNQDHQITHDQLIGQSPEPDPHPQYEQKKPIMLLGGTVDSFTLNTTNSKLVNYSLDGEGNVSGATDPIDGEITIPSDGIYRVDANIVGTQGNDTKEEWIELRLGINAAAPTLFAFLDVTTDKTSGRQLVSFASRSYTAGDVLSLWMWASAGLGTFTVSGCTFEVTKTFVT